ncbi:MAG: hypothetical protein U0R69_14280 [Gaiellales bacterium]
MLRRRLTLLAALLAALVAAGCTSLPGTSAEDAAAAKAVLEQANAAMEDARSLRFNLVMTGEASGQQFSMKMNGGAYLKGERAGDLIVEGVVEAPGMPRTSLGLISRRGAVYMNMGNGWQALPGGLGADATFPGQETELEAAMADFDFTKYVKDVKVERHTTFLGEPVTKIVGKIDTQALMGGMLDQLGGQLSGFGATPSTADLAGLGDVHATLYISEQTHQLRAAHISMSVEQAGQTVTIDLDLNILGINEKIKIPKPPAVVA